MMSWSNLSSKIFKSCLFLIACFSYFTIFFISFVPSSETKHYDEMISQNKSVQGPFVLETRQTVLSDGSDVNTNLDQIGSQTVEFEMSLKNIYISDPKAYFSILRATTNFQQLTPYDEERAVGIYKNYRDWDYDVNYRIQNWNSFFIDYCFLKPDHENLAWGVNQVGFWIKVAKIWAPYENYTAINAKVEHQLGDVIPYVFDSGEDVVMGVGVDRNFHNTAYDHYGMQFTKLKEGYVSDFFYSWVNRHLWYLSGFGLQIKSGNDMYIELEHTLLPTLTMWNLDFLFCLDDIEQIDENFFSVYLKLNQKYLDACLHIDSQYGITDDDLRFQTLSAITPLLEYNISYELFDPLLNNWIKYERQLTYDQLEDGIKIIIEINNDVFQIKNLIVETSEYVDDQTYIFASSTDVIEVMYKNVIKEDDIYTFSPIKNNSVLFVNKGNIDPTYLFVSQLTDEMILSNYVQIISNYGTSINSSMLKPEEYSIIRDPIYGTIEIRIFFDDHEFNTLITGFQHIDGEPLLLDCSSINSSIIAQDINEDVILNLLSSLGYEEYLLDSLSFHRDEFNNEFGTATFFVTNENILGQELELFSINPYFLKLNTSIDKEIFNLLPSEVTEIDVIDDILDISESFVLRSLDHSIINLHADDQKGTLTIEVKVSNDYNGIYNYSFFIDGFVKDGSKEMKWYLIVIGISLAISFALLVWGIVNVKRSKKLN